MDQVNLGHDLLDDAATLSIGYDQRMSDAAAAVGLMAEAPA